MSCVCPLCRAAVSTAPLAGADRRRYQHCGCCQLIFADPSQHLAAEEAKRRYASHRNSPDDPGYIQFLSRIVQPALPFLRRKMRGLDYGCGPGPTLSGLLRQAGLRCEDYDPLFRPAALRPPYDFIFSTECFEHFHQPGEEIARICALLRPGGLLAVMTECWTCAEAFKSWYYTRDPTHTVFYHAETFGWICRRFGLTALPQEDRRAHLFRLDFSQHGQLQLFPFPAHTAGCCARR